MVAIVLNGLLAVTLQCGLLMVVVVVVMGVAGPCRLYKVCFWR